MDPMIGINQNEIFFVQTRDANQSQATPGFRGAQPLPCRGPDFETLLAVGGGTFPQKKLKSYSFAVSVHLVVFQGIYGSCLRRVIFSETIQLPIQHPE